MAGRHFSTHESNSDVIDALHDGVPSWMKRSIDSWIREEIAKGSGYAGVVANVNTIERLERLLRVSLIGTDSLYKMLGSLFSRLDVNEDLKLDVVDGLLQIGTPLTNNVRELDNILEQSGSKWKVATNEGTPKLEERVDDSVIVAMDDLATQTGDASKYMRLAWNEAFGRNPNPSSAYSNVVKAVEAATWGTVTPNNSRATLGTIIGELKNNPENYKISIKEDSQYKGIKTITQDLSLIWRGQTDRHGTSNPVAPTQEAAEQAIFSGLSTCQQFTRGLISHT